MKKRVLSLGLFVCLVFIIFIILCNLVSSSYICDDGSEISVDRKEISEFEKKSVNGLGIAVIKAEVHSVLKKLVAEIIIGAEKISLDNETREEEISLASGDYTVTLLNTTDTKARIDIGGTIGEVNESEYNNVGDFYVILEETSKLEGGVGNTEIIIGDIKTTLSSSENPSEIIAFGDENYAVELFSASELSAIIAVSKCDTGNLTEEAEEPAEPVENATEEENATNIEEEENETSIEEENATDEEEVNMTEGENAEEKPLFNKLIWIVPIIAVIAIVYLIYRRKS